jgi:adenosylcobinamide-phosphate synthase
MTGRAAKTASRQPGRSARKNNLPSSDLLALHLPLTALAAVLLDRLFGEPRRFHPLVGFGRLAACVEAVLNRATKVGKVGVGKVGQRLRGLAAWGLVVLPPVALAFWLVQTPLLRWGLDVLLCYFALGARSLFQHGEAILAPLSAQDLPEARRRVGYIVSRDTRHLEPEGVARAGVESLLENGNDAIFATLFWFALLGGPGALLFRLANTLDAMWGYKNARFLHFGWAAARIDDLLNWLPARLTALTYALLGSPARAFSCWKTQARQWESPNAGAVMSAGAGSLGVRLGGSATYDGAEETRPVLGQGSAPTHHHLRAAIRLIKRGIGLWLAVFFLIGLVAHA